MKFYQKNVIHEPDSAYFLIIMKISTIVSCNPAKNDIDQKYISEKLQPCAIDFKCDQKRTFPLLWVRYHNNNDNNNNAGAIKSKKSIYHAYLSLALLFK